jgi:hypothetical protein
MEATGIYWKPVWHILSDGGFELVLANAAHVKNVPGCKTAVNDATWLADLMAHGLIRASFVPDEPTQQMRDLLRTRKQMVRERSAHTQRIQKTLEDANISSIWWSQIFCLGGLPEKEQLPFRLSTFAYAHGVAPRRPSAPSPLPILTAVYHMLKNGTFYEGLVSCL